MNTPKITESWAVLYNVKNAIRTKYAWPGGYRLNIVMRDGELLCTDCARHNYKQIAYATKHDPKSDWAAIGVDVYWEGPTIECCHCGAPIESEYGDPDADNEECES